MQTGRTAPDIPLGLLTNPVDIINILRFSFDDLVMWSRNCIDLFLNLPCLATDLYIFVVEISSWMLVNYIYVELFAQILLIISPHSVTVTGYEIL